jgi:ubiquinol oxidase
LARRSRSSREPRRYRKCTSEYKREPGRWAGNEEWHIILLEEHISGVHANPIRFRLLPQVIAFAVYQQFWLLRVLKPAWSYRLNADIEDHAEYEYAALVADHPEWETTPFRSAVAADYGSYDSLADMLRQIGATKASTRKSASPEWEDRQ